MRIFLIIASIMFSLVMVDAFIQTGLLIYMFLTTVLYFIVIFLMIE